MDSKFLKERIFSLKRQSEELNKPQFLGFLSEEEAVYANRLLGEDSAFLLFGGYKDASRIYLGVFPYNIPPTEKAFPISTVTFTYRKQDSLSHRDFLGAIMALGIKREAIGDILIEDGRAVVFSSVSVAKLLLSELNKVGRVGVTASSGFSRDLPESTAKINECFTVSSLRLDCIVAALCSVSRNTANDLILEKRVSVNSVPCEKSTKTVSQGDKITVRGYGKFTLFTIDGETRKGRIKITIQKYA